jgi:hypothetical protein
VQSAHVLDKLIAQIFKKTCAFDFTPFSLYVPNGTLMDTGYSWVADDTFGPLAGKKNNPDWEKIPGSSKFWSCVDVDELQGMMLSSCTMGSAIKP